LAQQKQRII